MLPIDKISNIGGINYGGISRVNGAFFNVGIGEGSNNEDIIGESEEILQKKRLGIIECEVCANRTYVDGSNDMGVSFKNPTKLTPTEAASQVPAHEMEHYKREAAKAEEEDREVLSNSIRIFTSVCSECGKTYVSGGVTNTVTRTKNKNNDIEALLGINTDNKENANSVDVINKDIANKAYGINFDIKG